MSRIRAALFDFGGVILPSPFDAFDRYERENALPAAFIRGLNATNPDGNAWAKLERSDVTFDEFCFLFEEEARAAGSTIDSRAVMALLSSDPRPHMIEAVRRCHQRLKTGLLTNNWIREEDTSATDPVMELFHVVVESSRVGVRKPDPRFYKIVCRELDIDPAEAVFLDDLGVNLKPARAMGMTTIKVGDPDEAISELEAVVGFPLR